MQTQGIVLHLACKIARLYKGLIVTWKDDVDLLYCLFAVRLFAFLYKEHAGTSCNCFVYGLHRLDSTVASVLSHVLYGSCVYIDFSLTSIFVPVCQALLDPCLVNLQTC